MCVKWSFLEQSLLFLIKLYEKCIYIVNIIENLIHGVGVKIGEINLKKVPVTSEQAYLAYLLLMP